MSRASVIADRFGGGSGGRAAWTALAVAASAPSERRRKATRGDDSDGAAPPVAEVDDRTLAAAQRHDRAAFGLIVARYQDRLRLLAYHQLHDRHLAQDAVQDTFVKAWRGLPDFRRGACLGTWLYRIAYRTCVDYERRRARRPEVADAGDLQASAPATPDDAVIERTELARVLDELPATQRLVVLLVDREGLDYRTVARILSVSPGTVCSRLSRARAALRRALRDDDERADCGEGAGDAAPRRSPASASEAAP